MATFATFDRALKLATADLQPEAIARSLADYAIAERNALISSGRASANYTVAVNGRRGASEYSVTPPGPIYYEFSLWEPVITFAIEEIRRRSPEKSGRFKSSFVVLANGQPVTDWDSIPTTAEVILTNSQPYIRKVEGGIVGGGKARHVFDGTKRALASRFGNASRNSGAIAFETRWLTIQGGVMPGVPYILKGRGRSRRKDRQAGQPITYPSIIMNMA